MTVKELSKMLSKRKFCSCDIEEILNRFLKEEYGIDIGNKPSTDSRGSSK